METSPGSGTATRDVPMVTAGLPAGVTEQDWVSMLIGSPIFDSVNEIENMLRNNVGEGGVAGAKGGRPYIDIKDAQWLCKGDLVPVDINELAPANFVVYRFGVFVTQMLRKTMDTPEVTLLLASNLPSNNYERNAFRNSFFYEHARRVLFVRQERMQGVGDFLVVIMHCLAHIKVDDLVDDQNPLFLREFYKVTSQLARVLFNLVRHQYFLDSNILFCGNYNRLFCANYNRLFCANYNRLFCANYNRLFCANYNRLFCAYYNRLFCANYNRLFCDASI